MSFEELRAVVERLAIGPGQPAQVRADLLRALSELGLALPGSEPMTDADLAASEGHTLLGFLDDSAGQVSLLVYADEDLPEVVLAALEQVNGMTAAGPDDLGSEHLAAVVRVLGLLGISPALDDWITYSIDAPPSAQEMDGLSRIKCVESVVQGPGSTERNTTDLGSERSRLVAPTSTAITPINSSGPVAMSPISSSSLLARTRRRRGRTGTTRRRRPATAWQRRGNARPRARRYTRRLDTDKRGRDRRATILPFHTMSSINYR